MRFLVYQVNLYGSDGHMITNDGRLGGNNIGRAGDGVYGDDHQVSLNLTS